MFTLRENLNGFLKEVQVGLARSVNASSVEFYHLCQIDKCAKVGLARLVLSVMLVTLVLSFVSNGQMC